MNDDTTKDRSFVEYLDETIAEHLSDEHFGVEELAREMGVSRTQLHRKLQLHTGKSASQLIRESRLKKARELLQEEKYTVSEIAYQVGFNSPTYFNTCFHEYYGYTPGEAKYRVKEKPQKQPLSGKKIAIIVSSTLVFFIILYFSLKFIPDKTQSDFTTSIVSDTSRLIILPVANLTGIDTADYIFSGIHRDLISEFQKISSLKCPSYWTSRNYKNTEKTLYEIASVERANYVVEPIISCLGSDSICAGITVYKAVPDEEQIWSQEYHIETSQIFNFLNDLTKDIAEMINAKLTAGEEQLFTKAKEVDPEALIYYQKGQSDWEKLSLKSIRMAMVNFQKAIEKDPDWGAPYTGMAMSYAAFTLAGVSKDDIKEDRNRYIEKALDLDPNSANAHFCKAMHIWGSHAWEEAEKEFKISLELNPHEALYRILYAHLLLMLHRFEEARFHATIALENDPERPFILGFYGVLMNYLGEYEIALEQAQKAIAIDSSSRFPFGPLAGAYLGIGDTLRWYEIMKKYNWWWAQDSAIAASHDKAFEEGGFVGIIKERIKLNEKVYSEGGNIAFGAVAERYLEIGDYDKAMDYLEKAYQNKSGFIGYTSLFVIKYPELKENPRYVAIMKKLNLPVD